MTKLPPSLSGTVVYEGPAFLVIAYGQHPIGETFEIVRTQATPAQISFLHGASARLMQCKCVEWQQDTPEETTVENFLDRITQLGWTSLGMH